MTNFCICCGSEIIGDGTERGDGYYCSECHPDGQCCHGSGYDAED